MHPEGVYFRTGECAHSLRELVALCQTHPKEAAEQLYARRFDPWLSRWGERQAAKAVPHRDHAHGGSGGGVGRVSHAGDSPRASGENDSRPTERPGASSAPNATAATHRAGGARRDHTRRRQRRAQRHRVLGDGAAAHN